MYSYLSTAQQPPRPLNDRKSLMNDSSVMKAVDIERHEDRLNAGRGDITLAKCP